MSNSSLCNRRAFIGQTVAAFSIAPALKIFADAPSKKVNVAVIGCGTMGDGNMSMFLRDSRCRVVAVCDPITEVKDYGYSAHNRGWGGRVAFKRKVDGFYKDNACRAVADWREIVGDPSIDAVCVTTPDHWHALIALAAMKAGKHVYCQKPMTLGISEGIAMTRVAKEKGIVFQVGSQQRSSSEFRVACEFIQNGYLGKCMECDIGLPGGRGPYWGYAANAKPTKPPAYFTDEAAWNMWQGPAQHWENNNFYPIIHQPMCWRSNSRTGGGMITDWGAHHIDILHWALGYDRSGPVAVENMKHEGFRKGELLDWAGEYSFDLVYANGFRAHVSNRFRNGLTFHAEKGDLFVTRGRLDRPDFLRKWSEKRDLKPNEVHLHKSRGSHEADFVDGILDRSWHTVTDCEIGHRSISACHIANICERLGISGAKWDPVAERFVNNDAANALLEVKHDNGWKLA